MSKRRKNEPPTVFYGRYMALPYLVLNSERFKSLHPRSVKLLLDIAMQYNSRNNGNLQATMNCMRHRGWTSNSQLTAAIRELLEKELIYLTRQGGLGMSCNLYAIGWQPINECPNAKLDVSPTKTPPATWMKKEAVKGSQGNAIKHTIKS